MHMDKWTGNKQLRMPDQPIQFIYSAKSPAYKKHQKTQIMTHF